MSYNLKSAAIGFTFLTLFFLNTNFNRVGAEQAAWGGNGGWWGGGNREWEGDFAGPGYRRTSGNFFSNTYAYPYCQYDYSRRCYYNCYENRPSAYYDEESVPGAAIYLDLRGRR